MSNAEDLFNEAYRLSVVEEKHRKAIEVCQQALSLDPKNYRIRVYLGMLLSDYGTTEEKEESRKHFMDAIRLAKNNAEVCDTWFEESAIHHLAIWEWSHESYLNASLLFLADVLICHSKESQESLDKILDQATPNTSVDIRLVIAKLATPESSR